MMRLSCGSLLGATAGVFAAAATAHPAVGTEILPFDSVTSVETEHLTGATTGRPPRLAGGLRAPRTGMRAPAVILMHGSSGIRLGTNAMTIGGCRPPGVLDGRPYRRASP